MADPDGNVFGPYDVEVPGSYAEPFTEEAWLREHDDGGVISGGNLTFSGLTAHLAPIHAHSHGSWLYREDAWDYASPPTTGSLPRRDLMVIRRTPTVGTGTDATPGTTVPLVLRGIPGGTPVDPDFDPASDERLWSWQVPASGGTVVTGIKDLRRPWSVDVTPGRPVRDKAERDALVAFKGLQVYRLDTGQVQLCTGISPTAWTTLFDPAAAVAPASRYIGTSTIGSDGTVTGATYGNARTYTATIPSGLKSPQKIKVIGRAYLATAGGVGAAMKILGGTERVINSGSISGDVSVEWWDTNLAAGSRAYTLQVKSTVSGQDVNFFQPYITVEIG